MNFRILRNPIQNVIKFIKRRPIKTGAAFITICGSLLLPSDKSHPTASNHKYHLVSLFDGNLDLKVKNKQDFIQLLNASSEKQEVCVIAILGSWNSGKSTLLNYLFFNKQPVFKAYEMPTTEGMDAVLVELTLQSQLYVDPGYDSSDTASFKIYSRKILLVDTEGLWATRPTISDVARNFIMQIFMMNIADIIIYNKHGSISQVDTEAIEKLDKIIAEQISILETDLEDVRFGQPESPDLKNLQITIENIKKRRPELIFFVNRDASNGRFGAARLAGLFANPQLKSFNGWLHAYSPDSINADENGIRLDLSGLNSELFHILDKFQSRSRPWRSLDSVFDDLLFVKAMINSVKDNQTVGPFVQENIKCPFKCGHCATHCSRFCWFNHRQHMDNGKSCNHSSTALDHPVEWRCRICNKRMVWKTGAWADLGRITFKGKFYSCINGHGDAGWEREWTFKYIFPWLCKGEQLRTNGYPYRKHVFLQ